MKHTEETKKKMSASRKGKQNKGTFKKGHVSRLGRPHTVATKEKMSKSHTNISEETREKMRIAQTGKKGSLASNWRGGVTPLYSLIRNSYEMRQWRSDVFTRDGFTCQECKDTTGGNLNADHIIPFIAIIKTFNLLTLEDAMSCNRLWDINNGRTLCVPCHRKTPTYGNNAKDFRLDIYGIS